MFCRILFPPDALFPNSIWFCRERPENFEKIRKTGGWAATVGPDFLPRIPTPGLISAAVLDNINSIKANYPNNALTHTKGAHDNTKNVFSEKCR